MSTSFSSGAAFCAPGWQVETGGDTNVHIGTGGCGSSSDTYSVSISTAAGGPEVSALAVAINSTAGLTPALSVVGGDATSDAYLGVGCVKLGRAARTGAYGIVLGNQGRGSANSIVFKCGSHVGRTAAQYNILFDSDSTRYLELNPVFNSHLPTVSSLDHIAIQNSAGGGLSTHSYLKLYDS